VAQPIGCFKGGQGSAAGGIGYDEHIAPTLSAADSGSNRTPALMHGMAVRRLTPVECERLQGFPDEYTAIAWRKKPASECPDGPRYKALGNSWAVPVVRWIGKRIQEAIE
jgi:DNA (cytosine-5)-methyltransferase 1